MRELVMVLPKRTWRDCWLGTYVDMRGGRVVLFSRIPVANKRGLVAEYVLGENGDRILADVDIELFNAWFGSRLRASTTYVDEVTHYRLLAVWNADGFLVLPSD